MSGSPIDLITERYQQWMAAIRQRDLETILSIYADHATYMPSGRPKASGREALRAIWGSYLQRQNFVAEYTPDIHVSSGGDMAYDIGCYKISMTKESVPVTFVGQYVVVWERIDDTWKAILDMDNESGPSRS
jgi:ketosteroid isomerase-like protein